MERFVQERHADIPFISMDAFGDIWVKGRSFPNDASDIYEPALRWLEAYKKEPAAKTLLTIELSSLNIGSSKYILYMIYHLQDIVRNGWDASIEWVYEEGDEDMIEVGADYEVMARIPFHYRIRTSQWDLAQKAKLSIS